MRDVPKDAKHLIDAHGRGAAGESLSRAMDCVSTGDKAGELHWFAVAMLVMDLQGCNPTLAVKR
jgi:hypothetical protein